MDLKALSSALGVTDLSLASSERLNRYLGIEARAVSLLALVNDTDSTVFAATNDSLGNGSAAIQLGLAMHQAESHAR